MFTSHEGKTYARRCEQCRIYQAGVAAYLSVGAYLDSRREFGVAAVNGVNDFVGEVHEGVAGYGVGSGNGLASVASVADGSYDRYLSQEGYVEFFSEFHTALTSENVVLFVRVLFRCEPCHVFHHAEDRYIDFFACKHGYTFACIGQRYLLGGADYDNTGDGEGLHEGEVDVACTGGHVDNEVVKFAPVGFANKLFEGIRSHGTTPQYGGVFIDEEAYGEEFHALAFVGYYEIAAIDIVHIELFVLYTKHFGHGGTEDIGVK